MGGWACIRLGPVPSDTKLLLTKNYSEIIIFEKLRISRVISGKSLSFPEILRAQFPSKIPKMLRGASLTCHYLWLKVLLLERKPASEA